MVPAPPPARRRLVERALRQYREALAYTLDDAAHVIECDPSKVSRIERGERGIRGKELRDLLVEYGVEGEQQALLTLLADPRDALGWHRDHADILPAGWRDYFVLETAAAKITAYEAQQIPALLQTPAYARAVAQVDPLLKDDAARDRAVEAVVARQEAILGELRTEVHLYIGQAALHQQVGGPEVMDAQLARLARTAADSGTVTVHVLTFEAGARAAAGDGSLALLEFAGAPDLGVVHLGGISGGTCLEGRGDLSTYTGILDQLRAFALSPPQSALLLRGLVGT
jgi:transcriptional regulator with XRE-family HTH domain